MRPVELLLLLADLLAFVALAVPLAWRVRWMRPAPVVAVLVAVAQVLVEGPRWQLVPAYTLTGLFLLAWLMRSRAPAGAPSADRTHRLVRGSAVGLGVLGLAVAAVVPAAVPVFRFPNPGGPDQIGTLTYHWVDTARPEVFSADPKARRELMVQIWYPARGDSSSPRAPYLPDSDAVTPALARLGQLPAFAFGHLKYVTTNAMTAAPVAADRPDYPVLIFMEGLDGFRQMNTFQVEELVSRGYVVAAVDQPYAAASVVFPDGRQVAGLAKDEMNGLIQQSISPRAEAPTLNGRAFPDGIIGYLSQDAVFTLDRLAALNQADPLGILTGRVDLQRAGIFGVSLGGIVAAEACRLDPRLRACLVMDAPMPADVVHAGLQQPSMWITRDAATMQLEGWPQADIDQHQTTMRAVFDGLSSDGYFVRVSGMFHANLTDVPYWSPLFTMLGVAGPIDEERAHSIVNAYSVAFFDRHLNGRTTPLLDAQASPDVLVETHRHR